MAASGNTHSEITLISNLLRGELYNTGYQYGFFWNSRRVVPDITKGFDEEFGRLLTAEYWIQDPETTRKEKVGTCLDAVLVMKELLKEAGKDSKIWMLFQKEQKKFHSVLTFEVDDEIVYLELTPQSGKENYGKELVFNSEDAFHQYWEKMNYTVQEITETCVPGIKPDFFLKQLSED